ncbi:MAG TPA: hypothetical protein VF618_28925 [Thermoanaerobaculia bacterium]
MKRILAAAALFAALSLSAQEKTPPPVTISGMLFGDYYSVISNHRESREGANGFWIRRGYLTADRDLGDAFSARLRLEVNQPGDFTTNGALEPYIKDAWLRWKRSPRLDISVGLVPTPTFDTVERFWGYRNVEKTPVDLHRLGSSRDLGVSLSGALDAANRVRYFATFGNGSGTGTETNEGKKATLAVDFAPTPETVLEVYADREDRPGATDRTLLQAFAGLQNKRFRAGLHYGQQSRDGGNDIAFASAFGAMTVRPNVSVLGRVDRMFDANPEGEQIPYLPFSATSASTLFIAGVDWKLHRYVSVIPNVEFVTYDDDLENDLFARVTLSFVF